MKEDNELEKLRSEALKAKRKGSTKSMNEEDEGFNSYSDDHNQSVVANNMMPRRFRYERESDADEEDEEEEDDRLVLSENQVFDDSDDINDHHLNGNNQFESTFRPRNPMHQNADAYQHRNGFKRNNNFQASFDSTTFYARRKRFDSDNRNFDLRNLLNDRCVASNDQEQQQRSPSPLELNYSEPITKPIEIKDLYPGASRSNFLHNPNKFSNRSFKRTNRFNDRDYETRRDDKYNSSSSELSHQNDEHSDPDYAKIRSSERNLAMKEKECYESQSNTKKLRSIVIVASNPVTRKKSQGNFILFQRV